MSPTSEPITTEIFDHLVDLAALELEPEEKEYLRRELNKQLKSVRELEAIEIPDDIPITSHGVPYSAENRPALRGDEVQPSESADDILEGAPEIELRYVVVPDIPHTELE